MVFSVWVENQFKVQDGQNVLSTWYKKANDIIQISYYITSYWISVFSQKYYYQPSGKTITMLIAANKGLLIDKSTV